MKMYVERKKEERRKKEEKKKEEKKKRRRKKEYLEENGGHFTGIKSLSDDPSSRDHINFKTEPLQEVLRTFSAGLKEHDIHLLIQRQLSPLPQHP
jgi:hypothetical protein